MNFWLIFTILALIAMASIYEVTAQTTTPAAGRRIKVTVTNMKYQGAVRQIRRGG